MARREMGQEELIAVKKNLNKEGTQMEEGEEGGAAVYVGSKEEVTKARQLAETEGRAPDLASYIVMHKEIVVRQEEFTSGLASEFKKIPIGAMQLIITKERNREFLLYFKDSSSNLAKVKINMNDIVSLKEKISDEYYIENDLNNQGIVKDDLKELGFSTSSSFERLYPRDIDRTFAEERLDKMKEEQQKGFAF